MKQITKYQAIDGKEFSDELKCIEYENLIKEVDKIMKPLFPKPENDGCAFANGSGFIQHDKSILKSVKLNLLNEIKNHIKHEWIQQSIDNIDNDAHPSYIGRLINDSGISPLNDAWYRFLCIDSSNREWGQPYFANNPKEGKQVQINPTK